METFGLPCEHPSTGLLNYVLRNQKNKLNKIFSVDYVFYSFFEFELNFSVVLTKVHSKCPVNLFDGKQYFENKILFFFTPKVIVWSLSGSASWQVLKTSFYGSQRFLEELYFLWENFPSNHFWKRNGKMLAFPWNASTWSSKLRSTSPDDLFEETL